MIPKPAQNIFYFISVLTMAATVDSAIKSSQGFFNKPINRNDENALDQEIKE